MKRRLIWSVVCVFAVGPAAESVAACGDKFLRPGRSPRFRAFTAIYPADILLYAPNASAENLRRYETTLERGGHQTHAVRSLPEMRAALASAPFDLVIAPLAEADPVQASVEAASTRPDLLPVVGSLSGEMQAALEQRFPHTLEEGNSSVEAITEIDHVMEERLKRRSPSAPR